MHISEEMSRKVGTVGLVGWYWRGNFGDDLMAILYALRLRSLGYKVLIWQLPENIANEYDCEVVKEIDDLVERSDVIVYGGGGLFTNAHRVMEPINGFGDAMDRLCWLVRRKNIPLLLSSVGGDGDATVLSKTQIALLETASLVTLRNKEDSTWFYNFSKSQYIYPDIVWRASLDLDIQDQGPKDTVIIHHCGRLEKLMLQIIVAIVKKMGNPIKLLSLCCERSLGVDNSDYSITYYSLKDTLELLQRTRLVITHRLHLGMTVLTLGGNVFAVRPEIKTRLVYERLGLSSYIVQQRKGLLRRFNQILRIIKDVEKPQLTIQRRAELASGAEEHINAIVRYLQNGHA